MGEVLFKVHESYRWVVAICDKDIYGQKLKEGNKVMDLTGPFFKGEEIEVEELKEEIDRCRKEDATFNIVGQNSVNVALGVGLIESKGVSTIEGVPFALVLL